MMSILFLLPGCPTQRHTGAFRHPGGIVYGLVGLVPTVAGFWKFMLTLVLFNLTTASVVLLLSIAFASIDVASLVGTLVMLFKYVFPMPSFASIHSTEESCV
jgi:hypothetical protein